MVNIISGVVYGNYRQYLGFDFDWFCYIIKGFLGVWLLSYDTDSKYLFY